MSDSAPSFKAPRPLEQVQQDYASLCAKVGDMQYRRDSLDKDIALVNKQLRDLNFEAIASAQAAQAAKAEAEKAAAEEAAKVVALEASAESPKAEESKSNE